MFRLLFEATSRVWFTWAQISAVLLVTGLLANCKEEATAKAGQPPVKVAPAQVQLPVAPDFDAGTDWLNTAKPISLADLRGRIVLLDFWTLC